MIYWLCLVLLVWSPPLFAQKEYGANEANSRFVHSTPPVTTESKTYDYLALKDHPGPSGVSLGGIGVGNVNIAPDGRFTRVALSNIERVLPSNYTKESFFAVWARSRSKTVARRLVRDGDLQHGLRGFQHSSYTGLFPTASIDFDNGEDESDPLKVSLFAYSGLVPHNVKDSSLPIVWFEVKLTAREDVDTSVAFSWQNVLGKALYDPRSLSGLDGPLFQKKRYQRVGAKAWSRPEISRSTADRIRTAGSVGVKQFLTEPIRPRKLTYQNYVDEIAIVTERDESDVGSTRVVSKLSAGEMPAFWEEFQRSGRLTDPEEKAETNSNNDPFTSVVSRSMQLQKGEVRTVRFALAWFFQNRK